MAFFDNLTGKCHLNTRRPNYLGGQTHLGPRLFTLGVYRNKMKQVYKDLQNHAICSFFFQKIHEIPCSHSQEHHDIQPSPSPVTCRAPKAPEVVELALVRTRAFQGMKYWRWKIFVRLGTLWDLRMYSRQISRNIFESYSRCAFFGDD